MTEGEGEDESSSGEAPEINLDRVPLLESYPFARIQRAQGPLRKKQRLGSWKSVWGIVVNSSLYIYDSYTSAQKTPPAMPRDLQHATGIQVFTVIAEQFSIFVSD